MAENQCSLIKPNPNPNQNEHSSNCSVIILATHA